ncbi:helix-turn-helix domain-containing protein [Streptomyces sp. NPDC006333]|uniref:winged helix-turn-helix transcriptional regulator n=1 Tax=Streptomyces sp. NPDC006333 TaxID=3156753 RepID=UPI0033B9BCD4
MRKTDLSGASCPIARSLSDIGDWWSLLIVRDALSGMTRFSEFQRSLGCARNILSARLAKLVERDVLAVAPASDGSAYTEYRLTEKGKTLRVPLVALRQWGEEHLFDAAEERLSLVDKRDGLPVARLELRAHDGRVLSPEDVETRNRGDRHVRDFPDETDDATPRERLLGVFEAQRVSCEAPESPGGVSADTSDEFRDPTHPEARQARFHRDQLYGYVCRQAERAGAREPEALAEQLVMLYAGAADHVLRTRCYPDSVGKAVDVLLTTHGID